MIQEGPDEENECEVHSHTWQNTSAGQRRQLGWIRMASSGRPSLSKNYRLIAEIVQASGVGRHLTTLEIYGEALKRRPGIGFSTIYRGLERLRDLGLVSELHVPGAEAATYEPAGSRHAHFRCSQCGEISDVDFAIPPHAIEALALQLGFEIENESVTFGGRCGACSSSRSTLRRRQTARP